MATRCLLLSENDLMVAGVRSALALHTDLFVYSLRGATDAEIQRATEAMQIDAIILDESADMVQLAHLLQLLKGQTNLQIVLLNHEENSMHIYLKQRFEVSQVSDLGSIVRNHQQVCSPT